VNETEAMQHAIELAWGGWGRVHPNPLVGAVVLADGQVAGEGFHAEFGEAHAETVALAAAGERARGAVLVVTLEPCAHQGKQPPCTDAALAAGIGRVVFGMRDPNPIAAGGAARLSGAGIDVVGGLLAEAVCRQNAIFVHRCRRSDRPFVALKLATSVDGRIADREGRSRWISGEPARDFVHWLRAGFDAIGVGGHTARFDDPSLTVRGSITPRRAPARVVFDRRGELPATLDLVRTAAEHPTIMVAGPETHVARFSILERMGIQVVSGAPTLAAGLARLREMGIESLLVEGGGRLAAALLAEGLVDRFYWIQSPLWLGDDGIPAFHGLPGMGIGETERWTIAERRSLAEDTLLVMDRNPCLPD